MSFNFFGTFTTSQFDELEIFSRIQSKDIKDRIKWLGAEAERVGRFITIYNPETGYPQSFTAVPPTSYAAKLMTAYRILGGIPERDMLLRTSDDPVFLTRGTNIQKSDTGGAEGGFSDLYSNGRRDRGNQRFDRSLGIKVEKLKKWQVEAIKHKREHLEFKIKRALDYSDQILTEKQMLTVMNAEESTNSVDQQITNLLATFFTAGRANVVADPADKFGLNIGRPTDHSMPNELQQTDAKALRG